jgi:hypothetical protein
MIALGSAAPSDFGAKAWLIWAGTSQFDPDGPIRVAQPSSCFDTPPERHITPVEGE